MNTAKKGFYQAVGALKVLTVMGSFVAGAMAMAYVEVKMKADKELDKKPYKRYLDEKEF